MYNFEMSVKVMLQQSYYNYAMLQLAREHMV